MGRPRLISNEKFQKIDAMTENMIKVADCRWEVALEMIKRKAQFKGTIRTLGDAFRSRGVCFRNLPPSASNAARATAQRPARPIRPRNASSKLRQACETFRAMSSATSRDMEGLRARRGGAMRAPRRRHGGAIRPPRMRRESATRAPRRRHEGVKREPRGAHAIICCGCV